MNLVAEMLVRQLQAAHPAEVQTEWIPNDDGVGELTGRTGSGVGES